MAYDDLKDFNGQKYTGMRIGGTHNWTYPNGRWFERKIEPNLWSFEFKSAKTRKWKSPSGSGAGIGSAYHWYIGANQYVRKVDDDEYQTLMEGLKFKVGHRRPHWKSWSYEYPEQDNKDKTISGILQEITERQKEAILWKAK